MKFKKILLIGVGLILLALLSEGVNYLFEPNSKISKTLSQLLINRSIVYAKQNNLKKSLINLTLASRINIYGEYGRNFPLAPNNNSISIPPPDNKQLETDILEYIKNIAENDIGFINDQGLGKIFYDLALISYEEDHLKSTEALLKLSMYNNPQFASFHGELINYYFFNGLMDEVEREMAYCYKFEDSKTLCKQYDIDSIKTNTPRDIGFLKEVVYEHYSK